MLCRLIPHRSAPSGVLSAVRGLVSLSSTRVCAPSAAARNPSVCRTETMHPRPHIQPQIRASSNLAKQKVHISSCATALTVSFSDGLTSKFDSIWLRDHCRCPECFHQVTKQRLVDTFHIPADIQISTAVLNQSGDSVELTFAGSSHKTVFQLEWLKTHSYNPTLETGSHNLKRTYKLWGAEITKNLPVVEFDEVMAGDEGLAKWLKNIDVYGIAFVKGVPPNCEATEQLGRRISFIRETHYGAFWDFTADNAHADTAYTGLALQAHTDSTYFTDPIGLQLFHMTEFTGKGGQSLYVDGFKAAAQLKEAYPEYYELLTQVCIPAHSAGDPKTIIAPSPRSFPILNIDPITQDLYQVRFNNDDRSVIDGKTLIRINNSKTGTKVDVKKFYAALKCWVSILRDQENEVWIQLEPGFAVIVDNWRVLHGRSAFTGHRRICGSYHGYDDYRSRVRDLCYGSSGRLDI